MRMKILIPLLGLGLALFGLGAWVGTTLASQKTEALSEALENMHPLRESDHNYDFIDPLLSCIFPESDELEEYGDFEDKVQSTLDDLEGQGKINQAAYYFRDLNVGRWVGINEDLSFEPASLFKVPVMMAYYKAADTDPSVLTTKIEYTDDAAAGAETEVLVKGRSYTVNELIETMIIESDNTALNLLLTRLNESVLKEIFTDLGIPYPEADAADPYTISPREYSLFFRVLYNGTYLSPARSEQALELMSRATFDHGITPVLPDDVQVSHKFGERRLFDEAGQPAGYELHDCGIVYYPEHPYFLCVFTQGDQVLDLTQALGQLSDMSYTEMDILYGHTQD